MAITVKHKYVSAIPDAGDTSVVQPSNWNDDHQLTGTVPIANGGTGASDAPTALSNLGAYPASNPSGYNTGTVTSVSGTAPVNVATGTTTPVISLSTTGSGNVVLDTGATQAHPTISDYETFTPTSAPSYAEGEIWYDSTQKALTYYNDVTNNAVHIGQEVQLKVINNTGSSISNGTPVYVTGTSSGQTYPNIALAKADAASTSAVLGLTNGAIASGATGYVCTSGLLAPCNTGSFTVGQVLYLSPYSAGQMMNTIPPTGYAVQIGVVAYANTPNGSIYVKQTTPLAVSASTITGTVAVNQGGTGANTLTGYVKGIGTSAMTASSTIPNTDISGLGTMSTQNSNAVAITGGTIDGTTIGGTTSFPGTFTTLNSGIAAHGGTASTSQQLLIGGNSQTTNTSNYGIASSQVVQSAITTTYGGYQTAISTQATSFTLGTLGHFLATQGTIGSGSTVTTQIGFWVNASLIGATNNYGFYGNIPSATSRWNAYMAGTAANYFAGQVSIGNTVLTNGYVGIAGTQSATAAMLYVGGTDTFAGNPIGLQISSNLNGTAATTAAYGLQNNPIFSIPTGATIGSIYGTFTQPTFSVVSGSTVSNIISTFIGGILGSTVTPTTYTGSNVQLNLNASATGGTITNVYAYNAAVTSINASATTGATSWTQYAAQNVAGTANSAIGTAYAFYGNQASSNTGVTSNWNLYMNGTANNYMNGSLGIGTTAVGTTASSLVVKGLHATSAAAPTIASATTIAPTTQIVFVSGTTPIATITAPSPISAGGGQITIIPTGVFTTLTTGNIALASTSIVSKALIMTYDTTTAKWYPSY